MLFCHVVITVCGRTFVTCTLVKINHQSLLLLLILLYVATDAEINGFFHRYSGID